MTDEEGRRRRMLDYVKTIENLSPRQLYRQAPLIVPEELWSERLSRAETWEEQAEAIAEKAIDNARKRGEMVDETESVEETIRQSMSESEVATMQELSHEVCDVFVRRRVGRDMAIGACCTSAIAIAKSRGGITAKQLAAMIMENWDAVRLLEDGEESGG